MKARRSLAVVGAEKQRWRGKRPGVWGETPTSKVMERSATVVSVTVVVPLVEKECRSRCAARTASPSEINLWTERSVVSRRGCGEAAEGAKMSTE